MSMFWIGYAAGFVTFPVVFGLLALGFLLLVPHWPNPTCGLSCIPCDETLIEDDSTRTVSGFIAELKYVIHRFAVRVPPPLGAGRNHGLLSPYYA